MCMIQLQQHTLYTIITLFQCGNIYRQHLLSENLLVKYYSSTKLYSIDGRWVTVIPSLITATTYLALAQVGYLEHFNSSLTAAAQLFLQLQMIATHIVQLSTSFSQLLVKHTTTPLTARLRSRLIILNLYNHALCFRMCIGNFLNWKYFRMVTPIPNLFLAKYFHTNIK